MKNKLCDFCENVQVMNDFEMMVTKGGEPPRIPLPPVEDPFKKPEPPKK
jgi:hypothetical protein